MEASEVLKFWFEELNPKQHWVKDPELDQLIGDRFKDVLHEAGRGELFSWRTTSQGRLAEILVLDQFSRNIYRNKPESFQFDPIAAVLSQEAWAVKAHEEIEKGKSFLYMPLMHSESRKVHDLAVEVFTALGPDGALEFEMKHKVIIDRFGRYPHRNEILGRQSTEEEIEFLKGPGSSF